MIDRTKHIDSWMVRASAGLIANSKDQADLNLGRRILHMRERLVSQGYREQNYSMLDRNPEISCSDGVGRTSERDRLFQFLELSKIKTWQVASSLDRRYTSADGGLS